jgi:hypothetical protein
LFHRKCRASYLHARVVCTRGLVLTVSSDQFRDELDRRPNQADAEPSEQGA